MRKSRQIIAGGLLVAFGAAARAVPAAEVTVALPPEATSLREDLRAEATGKSPGTPTTLTARLANLALVATGINGSAMLDGTLRFPEDSLQTTDIDARLDGTTRLTAGAYIFDNLYSEVSADSEGNNRISLNPDLNPSVTITGRTSTTGNTGIGVFFEKDY